MICPDEEPPQEGGQSASGGGAAEAGMSFHMRHLYLWRCKKRCIRL